MLLPQCLTSPKTHTKKKTKGAMPMHKEYPILVLTPRDGGEVKSHNLCIMGPHPKCNTYGWASIICI